MKYAIFCDESGIIDERYMVLGGIILPKEQVEIVEKKIKLIKEQQGFYDHEVKMHSLKNMKKLYLYQEILLNTYLNKQHNIDFGCIIFDSTQVRHKDFNHINDHIHYNERGFYKQYYQLFYHQFFKLQPYNSTFYCYIDEKGDKKTSSICISELFSYLKNNYKVKTIESNNSKFSELLQLADLLVGSVALQANNRSTRKEKLGLAQFLAIKKNLQDLSATNYSSNYRVWRFDYTKSKKYRP